MKHRIIIEGREVKALGFYDEVTEQVTIEKGSTINPNIKDYVDDKYLSNREKLRKDSVINENTFLQDYTFDSPSEASSFVLSVRGNYSYIILAESGKPLSTITEGLKNLRNEIKAFKDIEKFNEAFNQEKYKLELLIRYKKNWDIYATDFLKMLKDSFDSKSNIFISRNYYPLNNLIAVCESKPETIRELFINLYDESRDLETRLNHFADSIEKEFDFVKGRPTDKAAHKDLRVITVFLTFEYPSKYFFYKSTEAEEFNRLFFKEEIENYGNKTRALKVIHFFTLMNRLLDLIKYLTPDVVENYKRKLLENGLKDDNLHFLAFNIYWYITRRLITEQESKSLESEDIWDFAEQSFTPIISKETFISLLEDKSIFTENRLAVIDKISQNQIEGISTRELEEKYGNSAEEYKSLFLNLAKDINQILGLNYQGQKDAKDWPVIGKGKAHFLSDGKKVYRWALKENLFVAYKDFISNKLKTNQSYLIPWNPDQYSLDKALKENGYVYWGDFRSSDYAVGDYLYFYASGEMKKIIYLMEVVEVGLDPKVVPLPDPYWLTQSDKDSKSNSYFKLKPIKENKTASLTFKELGSLGLDQVFLKSPKNLKTPGLEKVFERILDVFSTKASIWKETETEEVKLNLINDLNQILYGPPGTGKTFWTKEFAVAFIENRKPEMNQNLEYISKIRKKYKSFVERGNIVFTTFHQSYSYEDFIESLAPIKNESNNLKFDFKNGVFKNLVEEANRRKNEIFVIIIDEINRGNISRIFGELITLVEADKRQGSDNEVETTLPISKQKFSVPRNLFLLGTMNSSDKSISLVDIALRRRFRFIEMKPEAKLIKDLDLRKVLNIINLELIQNDNGKKDALLGHSYFMDRTIEELPKILNQDIIPLLYEYFDDREEDILELLEKLKPYNISIERNDFGRITVK